MSVKRGKLVVIVAPSGTGKSTLIKRLNQEIPDLKWSVSNTTRPMREGEEHGVDYFFVKKEEFEKKIKENAFIEWALVHSNYYGTSKKFVDEGLAKGDFLLFDIDVQGCDEIKKIYKDEAKVIFIQPPSIEELEQRLRRRATESDEVINERIANAREEMKRKDDFDFIVVNDEIEKAYQDLRSIVRDIMEYRK